MLKVNVSRPYEEIFLRAQRGRLVAGQTRRADDFLALVPARRGVLSWLRGRPDKEPVWCRAMGSEAVPSCFLIELGKQICTASGRRAGVAGEAETGGDARPERRRNACAEIGAEHGG
jgi:hypothetical protein